MFFAYQGGTSFRAKIQPVGPSCQVEETFFSLIRRNFPCVRPWTSWVPAVRLSTYSPLLMTLVCWPCRTEHNKAMDDGEALDGNDSGMGKPGTGVAD